MKVKFNRAALQESLALAATIVPTQTTKPILQCLKIEATEDGQVGICATDFEIGITCAISQAEVEQAGEVVIPAGRLTAIIRESQDEVIQLEAAEATCHIKGADSHFTIYGYQGSQYPAVPGFEGAADMEISLVKLQEGIEHTLFATAKENTRYALNGVLWEAKGKKLVLVGTDGRRLAKFVVALAKATDSKAAMSRIIVPGKAMALLDRIGGSEQDTVAVRFVDNKIILASGDIVISSNLVEGNFPKYEDIIPTDYDKKITIDSAKMLSAVKRAALLTNEDSKGIKMSLSDAALVITSRAPETGDAEIDMEVEYKGEPVDIGFNPQFLVDVLRVVRDDSISLELSQGDRPGLIKSGQNFIYIVMPVNLGG